MPEPRSGEHLRTERSKPLRPEQTNNPKEKPGGVRGERSAPPGIVPRGTAGTFRRAECTREQVVAFRIRIPKPPAIGWKSNGSEPDDFQPQPAAATPASRTARLDGRPIQVRDRAVYVA